MSATRHDDGLEPSPPTCECSRRVLMTPEQAGVQLFRVPAVHFRILQFRIFVCLKCSNIRHYKDEIMTYGIYTYVPYIYAIVYIRMGLPYQCTISCFHARQAESGMLQAMHAGEYAGAV